MQTQVLERKLVAAASLVGFDRAIELLTESRPKVIQDLLEHLYPKKIEAKLIGDLLHHIQPEKSEETGGVVHFQAEDGSLCRAVHGNRSGKCTGRRRLVTCKRCLQRMP